MECGIDFNLREPADSRLISGKTYREVNNQARKGIRIKVKNPLDKLSGLAAIFASGSSLGPGEQTSAEN